MKKLPIALLSLGALCWLAGRAQVPPQPSPTPHRYLFIVDTSFSMSRVASAVRGTVYELIANGVQHRLQRNDVFEVWTFSTKVSTRLCPAQTWRPELAEMLAGGVFELLSRLRYQDQGILENVVTEIKQAVQNHPELTVIILSDGEGAYRGTPFDTGLNTLLRQRRREVRQSKKALLVVFRARHGKFISWTSNLSGEPIQFVDEVPLLASAPPRPAVAAELAPPKAPETPQAPAPVTPTAAKAVTPPESAPIESKPVEKTTPPPIAAAPQLTKEVARQEPLPVVPAPAPPAQEQTAESRLKPEPQTPAPPAGTQAQPPGMVPDRPPAAPGPVAPQESKTEPAPKPEPPSVRAESSPGSAQPREREPAASAAVAAPEPKPQPVQAPPPQRTEPVYESSKPAEKKTAAAQTAAVVPPEASPMRWVYLAMGVGLLFIGLAAIYWYVRSIPPATQPSLISQSLEKRRGETTAENQRDRPEEAE
jgi:hypothetical protein